MNIWNAKIEKLQKLFIQFHYWVGISTIKVIFVMSNGKKKFSPATVRTSFVNFSSHLKFLFFVRYIL